METARPIDRSNAVNADERAKTPSPVAALFDSPWTSLHTGAISGGTGTDITAKHCQFDIGYCATPDADCRALRARILDKIAADIEAGMKAVHPEARIDIDERFAVPSLKPEVEGATETLARALNGDNAEHIVSYGTEVGQFQKVGYSVVVCGPGDIAQAHKPDEFIAVSRFQEG